MELSRGLELGQQEFAKYIPDYLGRFALWLPPAQLEELLADLSQTLNAASVRMVASALDTVGVIYEEYDTYRARFPEEPEAYRSRRERLLGMLMKRLAGSDGGARQEAMFVLGRRVFGSGSLGEHEKRQAFLLTEQKLLETCYEEAEDALTFYYRASMLGRVYRFMTEQRLFHGGFPFEEPRPIAFSPAPSIPSPCPTRASSGPSGTGASRCCWPSTNFPGPSGPSPTASAAASRPCPWPTSSTFTFSRRTSR